MKIIKEEIRKKIFKMPDLIAKISETLAHSNTMSTYVMIGRNTSKKLRSKVVKALILEALNLPEEDVYNTEEEFFNSKA